MQVFTVHLRREGLDPDRDVVLVKEGFCWPAFLLSGVWALWHRLWLAAAVIVSAALLCSGLVKAVGGDALVQSAVGIGFGVLVGLLANDLRRRRLARDGFADAGVVCGTDADAALLHFLRAHPEIVPETGGAR